MKNLEDYKLLTIQNIEVYQFSAIRPTNHKSRPHWSHYLTSNKL